MRKTLIPLLLAGALAPVAASAQDGREERGWRASAERGEQAGRRENDDRPQRTEPDQRGERAARPDRVERAATLDSRPDPTPRTPQSRDLERVDRSSRMQDGDRQVRGERPAPSGQAGVDAPRAQPRQVPMNARRARQSQGTADGQVDEVRQTDRNTSSVQSGGHDSHDGDHDRDWSRDWRKDRKYDWWGYRNRYRSLFRLGHYYDPYGWGYRRWSIGWSLWPSYYGSGFWLNDPWMYRLPPAYGPYRWVRYYDDALLVNIYTGHVVDVIYNFFW